MGGSTQANAANATDAGAMPPGTNIIPVQPAGSTTSSDARTRDAARTRDRDVR